MFTNRLIAQACTATMLLAFSFTLPTLGAQDCADIPLERVIEKIPAEELTGSTCISNPDENVINLESYGDKSHKSCPLAGVKYPGHDVIYKVKLNEGNEVAFLLTPDAKDKKRPDLVLTLITACDDGLSCVSSSPDFIGSGKEEIPSAQYKEGVYYLVVDSFDTTDDVSCGTYHLKVTGVNPTPDLSLEIKTKSKRAVAGEDLVYTLTIFNSGDAEARDVKLTLTLPPGVTYGKSNIVEVEHIPVPKRQDDETPGKWTTDLTASVGRSLEGKMITSARAEIRGYPPAQDSLTTTVDHKHDLSVELTASTTEAVAGKPRKYTLTLHNDGPSDATNVTATLSFDSSKEDLISNDCPLEGGQFVCSVGPLQEDSPEESRTFHFEVGLKSSATASISHQATIRTDTGTDLKPKNNNDSLDDMVIRDTDLVVDSVTVQGTGLEQTKDTVTVAAGADFTYVIGITNAGPSDSSGGTVTIRGLPGYLKSFSSESRCDKFTQEDGSFLVTCKTYGITGKGGQDTVKFSLATLPDLGERTFHATAEVASQEEPANIKDKEFDTNIVIQADLQFKTPPTAPASGCGGDILYTMEVINKGPSNSTAGKVTAELDGLSFLSSPNDCKPESGADNKITCSVGDLPVDDPNNPSPSKIQFWASPTKLGVVTNQLSIQGERDPDAKVVTDLSTTLSPTADLEVTLTASVNPLTPGQPFTYDVAVTNHGPLKAFNVQVEVVTDPPGLLSPPNVLDFGDIAAGSPPEIRNINARAPQESGVIITTATLQPRACDSNSPPNNVAKINTTVAKESDADLSLTMTAKQNSVSSGDSLEFELTMVNEGFATAEEVTTTVTLPLGLTFELSEFCSLKPDDPPSDGSDDPQEDQQIVLCTAGTLESKGKREASFSAKVGADGAMLKTMANVASKTNDPNTSNNKQEVLTQRVAPLVAPFVDAAHPTTIFTLKNPSESEVLNIKYSISGIDSTPVPLTLSPKETTTVSLLDIAGLEEEEEPKFGHVEITSPADFRPMPYGDFTLVDSEKGTATGERLISTATDLCNGWSVRFLNGRPLGSSTELLFFVPDNPGGEIATGRVFSESGRFVSDIEAKFTQESYRFTDVPEGSGSIEWTFAPGIVGSITAIHTFSSSDEVAVPGFCRDHGKAKTLILPFFQADGAINTYVAIRNETNESVQAEITYLYADEGEEKTQKKEVTLAGHAVWTEGLRGALSDKTEELPSSKTGFLKIEAFDPQEDDEEKTAASALSGDFIRVGPAGLAGSALVEKLCTRWDVRFKPGTSFLFYLDQSGSPEGKVYKENGMYVDMVSAGDQPAQRFLVSAPNLEQVSSGSVEWNLGVPGYVAMLLSGEGGQSVLIPGACLPEEEAPED